MTLLGQGQGPQAYPQTPTLRNCASHVPLPQPPTSAADPCSPACTRMRLTPCWWQTHVIHASFMHDHYRQQLRRCTQFGLRPCHGVGMPHLQLAHGSSKTGRRGFAQKACGAMQHALAGTAAITGNHWTGSCHGFQWNNAEVLINRRVEQCGAGSQQSSSLRVRERRQEPNLHSQQERLLTGSCLVDCQKTVLRYDCMSIHRKVVWC